MSELKAEQIKKRYKSRVVVKDVSLEVRSGEVIGLLGPKLDDAPSLFELRSRERVRAQ